MHADGQTFEEIAEANGTVVSTAFQDVEAAKALLDDESRDIARAARQKELDSLDWQEEEAQRAYERSLRPGQRTTKVGKAPKLSKKQIEAGVKPAPIIQTVTITDEQRDGDSKWIAEIRAIQKRRAELLKYDPGQLVKHTGKDGEAIKFDVKQEVTHDINTDALDILLERADAIRAFNLLLSHASDGESKG